MHGFLKSRDKDSLLIDSNFSDPKTLISYVMSVRLYENGR